MPFLTRHYLPSDQMDTSLLQRVSPEEFLDFLINIITHHCGHLYTGVEGGTALDNTVLPANVRFLAFHPSSIPSIRSMICWKRLELTRPMMEGIPKYLLKEKHTAEAWI